MNSIRPLILMRADSDVSQLAHAVQAAVSSRTGDGLLLLEIPTANGSRGTSLLDFWRYPEIDNQIDEVCERGQKLTNELAHIGLRFRVELARGLDHATIMKYAARFRSDLIITERQENIAGQFLSYLNDDTNLILSSDIPVWLCGHSASYDSPIVAAIDPSPESQSAVDSNSRVIRTAYSLAQRFSPRKKIHFLAVAETSSRELLVSDRRRVQSMNELRSEIFNLWSRNTKSAATNASSSVKSGSAGVPVQISMHFGSTETMATTLDEIGPCVVVTGKPLRSAIQRFFRSGMLSTFVKGDHSVLTVMEQALSISACERRASLGTLQSPVSPYARDSATPNAAFSA